MENILIPVSHKKDVNFLLELIRKLGYKYAVISESEKQIRAKIAFMELSNSINKSDLSNEEIIKIVKEVRNDNEEKN